MAITVKQKIRQGTLFLFFLLLMLGGVCIFHIVRLNNDSKLILKNNYESLDYCHAMLRALDSIPLNAPLSITNFENALLLQEQNLTEHGEKEASDSISVCFSAYRNGDSSATMIRKIHTNIQKVLLLNMSAIENKNRIAAHTADKALIYISLIGAVIFIVGLTFSFNFPSIITNPINAFMEGIQQIMSGKYHHRIHLHQKDEFGQMANTFNEMAEKLEYFENSNLNKIIFEKTRAEAVINSLKDASIGIDRNNIILFANNEALQLLGVPSKDIVAQKVATVSSRNDLFKFLVEENNTAPFKVVVGGQENYFVRETVDIGQQGENGKVIILKNITSFKELDVAKTQFIATISHELKTPLASSDFSLKLLEDKRVGVLSAEQQELVQQLKEDNKRMLRILSELLNMSQAETGRIEVIPVKVNPSVIIQAAMNSVGVVAKDRGVNILNQTDRTLPDIKADIEKATWVLNNLLTNAVKFSPAGGTVLLHSQVKDNEFILSVKDEGAGIPAEYATKIFERYFKLPGNTTEGSGLGLTISKDFIEAMGGTIWVESQPGQGACFYCAFLLA